MARARRRTRARRSSAAITMATRNCQCRDYWPDRRTSRGSSPAASRCPRCSTGGTGRSGAGWPAALSSNSDLTLRERSGDVPSRSCAFSSHSQQGLRSGSARQAADKAADSLPRRLRPMQERSSSRFLGACTGTTSAGASTEPAPVRRSSAQASLTTAYRPTPCFARRECYPSTRAARAPCFRSHSGYLLARRAH